MNQNVLSQVLEFLRRKMWSRRWQRAVTCLAAVAVFGVTYALILPAITMSRPHPQITAEQLTAWTGDELTLHVSAEAAADEKDKVFVLSMDEAGADLTEKYVFNEDGVALITAKDDAENEIELELHRVVRENTKKDQVIVDYWFTLDAGTKAEFDLDLLDEVDEARFTEVADRLKRLASEEKAAAASASDAVKTADATASNAKKGETAGKVSSDNATASNAASSQTASGSNADEVQVVVEKDDDGFEQILDGAIINDLEQEEEEDVQFEISAVAKVSAGSGDDLEKAKKDADMGADKRENGQLKFQWKTETTPAPEMMWSENGANIAVFYDEDAEIPGDAVLEVREILEGTEEYNVYFAQTKDAFANAPDSDKTKGVSAARFFDITIRDAEGNEVEPAAPVKVVITYDEPMVKTEDGNVNVLHFKEDAPEMVKLNNGEETDAGALSFTTDSFSVYALFGVETFKAQIMSADGNTYEVTMTCGPEAKVPATAKLAVREILPGTEEYETAAALLKPSEKQEKETAGNGYSLGAVAGLYNLMLDISIKDGEEEIEPLAPVDVKVELKELSKEVAAEDLAADLSVKHLKEEKDALTVQEVTLEKTEATAKGTVVAEFKTDSFSVFAFDNSAQGYGYGWKVHYGVMENGVFHEFGEDAYQNVACTSNPGPLELADHTRIASVVAGPSHNKGCINLIYDFKDTGNGTDYMYSKAYFSHSDISGGAFQECSPVMGKPSASTPSTWGVIKKPADGADPSYSSFAVKIGQGGYSNGHIYICYEEKYPVVQGENSAEILDIADLPQPEVNKTVAYNNDGTATLSLSITGHEAEAQQHGQADVILVLDLSSSMVPSSGTNRLNAAKTALNALANTLLTQNPDTGEPYIRMGIVTFAQFAKLNHFPDGNFFTSSKTAFTTLLGTNSTNGLKLSASNGGLCWQTNWEDALLLANSVQTRSNTDSYIIFITDGDPTVRNTRGNYKIGAQHHGVQNAGFTPSYNTETEIEFGASFAARSGVYGTAPNYIDRASVQRCYDAAVPEAQKIYEANKHFYSINCLGTASRMTGITTVACGGDEDMGGKHSFDAQNQQALTAAFDQIVHALSGYVGYNNVVINDQITDLTELYGKKGDTTTQFTYTKTKNGVTTPITPEEIELTGMGEAVYDTTSKSVKWEMGQYFALDDQTTYTASCTLWPSQDAFDAVAAYENDPVNNPLPAGVTYNTETGKYESVTNGENIWTAYTRSTVRGSVYTPKVIFRPNGSTYGQEYESDPSVHFSGQTYEDPQTHQQVTVGYPTITRDEDPLIVMPMQLQVQKAWTNNLDTKVYTFTLTLNRDGNPYGEPITVTTSGTSPWTSDPEFVSCGLVRLLPGASTGEVILEPLESGHTYTLTEDDHNWAFSSGEYLLMAVGDARSTTKSYTPTVLKEVTGNDIPAEIDGKDYCESNGHSYFRIYFGQNSSKVYMAVGTITAVIEGENIRHSHLNLMKQVVSASGTTPTDISSQFATSDFEFNFEFTLPEGHNENEVWFSVFTNPADEATIKKDLQVSSNVHPQQEGGENTGYYYVSENESFTVKIRPTWNLRFINLPQGTEYQISETLVDPFNFYSADCSPDDDADFQINGETTVGTGKIGAEDKSYLVTYKNTCRTFDTEVLKRNADNTATASNAHFALYTKEEYEKTPKGDPIFADITDENGNGIIQLGSLAIGEYKLVETKAPNGYILLTDPVKITVDAVNGVTYEQEGNSLSGSGEGRIIEYREDENGDYVLVDDVYVPYQASHAGETRYKKVYDIIVTNTAGVELPHTGGPGTTLYTLGGLMLLLASALLYGFRRRHEERRSA